MDPVALAAHGESLWHRLGLAALGPTTFWWRPTDRAT